MRPPVPRLLLAAALLAGAPLSLSLPLSAGEVAEPQAAVAAAGLDAAAIEQKFKAALGSAASEVVSLEAPGPFTASGVLIGPRGPILTVAHFAKDLVEGRKLTVELADGRKFQAKRLGYDFGIDFALLDFVDPPEEDLPHARLASTTAAVGSYCFLLGHPAGKLPQRPAQPRLGRITNTDTKDGRPWILITDCDMQAGDSGGPVYDLEGKLIAIASFSGPYKRFNGFAAIEQFHLHRGFLATAGNHRGELTTGPGAEAAGDKIFCSEDKLELFTTVLKQRLSDKHAPTIQFLKARKKNDQVELDGPEVLDFLRPEYKAIMQGRAISYGLDDPRLLTPLDPMAARLSGFAVGGPGDDKNWTRAIRVAPGRLIAKSSSVPKGGVPLTAGAAHINKVPVKVLHRDPAWDLVVLSIPESTPGDILPAATPGPEPVAGDLLYSADVNGNTVLGNAMDRYRTDLKHPRDKVQSPFPISDRSGPYPLSLAHSVPLYAQEACTPVFTLDGRLAGIHIARVSRAYGLLVPPEVIGQVLKASEGKE